MNYILPFFNSLMEDALSHSSFSFATIAICLGLKHPSSGEKVGYKGSILLSSKLKMPIITLLKIFVSFIYESSLSFKARIKVCSLPIKDVWQIVMERVTYVWLINPSQSPTGFSLTGPLMKQGTCLVFSGTEVKMTELSVFKLCLHFPF